MEKRIAVIGTIFVDCKGFAGDRYNPYGRNLGSIRFVHGGVGRNVVENLAFLQLPTFFVSTVDNSALGSEIVDRLRKCKVNLDFLAYAKERGMGMWMAILDQKGNLVGSISQMPDLALLEGLIEEKVQQIVEASSYIVLELDLNEHISRRVVEMAQKLGRRIFGIPGNLEVVLNNLDLLIYTDCFICNDIEAGRLLGIDLNGMNMGELQNELVKYVLKAGLSSMVITLGERGSVYYDSRTKECGYQGAFQTEVIDSSGAGDAFFSGTVMGLVKNRPLSEAVVYGTRVASWTIQVEENTCTDLATKIRHDELFTNDVE